MRTYVLVPHADDEVLFAGYIIQQKSAVVCYFFMDGREEPTERTRVLSELGGFEISCTWREWRATDMLTALPLPGLDPCVVYVPYPEPDASHHSDHNELGLQIYKHLGIQHTLVFYTTYTRLQGKTGPLHSEAVEVKPQNGEQVQRKLRAMAEYRSQMDRESTREHFTRDLREWVIYPKRGEMWWEK